MPGSAKHKSNALVPVFQEEGSGEKSGPVGFAEESLGRTPTMNIGPFHLSHILCGPQKLRTFGWSSWVPPSCPLQEGKHPVLLCSKFSQGFDCGGGAAPAAPFCTRMTKVGLPSTCSTAALLLCSRKMPGTPLCSPPPKSPEIN